MNDLTEKLKELLMWCVVNNEIGNLLYTAGPGSCCLTPAAAEFIAKQLAPEIEKMMPRWIPVSERLPDEFDKVDIVVNGKWFTDMYFYRSCGGFFSSLDGSKSFNMKDNEGIHWMPIPKGPTK